MWKHNVGSEVIVVIALQDTYPHLALLYHAIFCHEMIPGHEVYHAIHPLESFEQQELLTIYHSLSQSLGFERSAIIKFNADLF